MCQVSKGDVELAVPLDANVLTWMNDWIDSVSDAQGICTNLASKPLCLQEAVVVLRCPLSCELFFVAMLALREAGQVRVPTGAGRLDHAEFQWYGYPAEADVFFGQDKPTAARAGSGSHSARGSFHYGLQEAHENCDELASRLQLGGSVVHGAWF